MNPFYFGSSERPLYGVHHPPRQQTMRDTGVVLCYPFGQEYMRAHRAFRQLAMLLTRSGFNVLRFDYSGTGDSGGMSDDGDIGRWIEDASTAADELKETASVSRVSFVGLRLGASIAAAAAAARTDVSRLVLWDPVVSGRMYHSELMALAQAEGAPSTGPGGAVGVMGFPVTPELSTGISAVDLNTAVLPRGLDMLIVGSAEHASYAELEQHIAAGNSVVRRQIIPSPGNWGEVDNFGSALIPQAIIRAVVTYLAEEKN